MTQTRQHAGPDYVFDTKHDRYPVSVHVLFVRPADGRVLLMRRAGSGYADGMLGLPAGHVDLGETPTASAVREIAEELGVRLDPAPPEPGGTMFGLSLEPRVDLFFLAHSWAGRSADSRTAQVHRTGVGRPRRPARRRPGLHLHLLDEDTRRAQACG